MVLKESKLLGVFARLTLLYRREMVQIRIILLTCSSLDRTYKDCRPHRVLFVMDRILTMAIFAKLDSQSLARMNKCKLQNSWIRKRRGLMLLQEQQNKVSPCSKNAAPHLSPPLSPARLICEENNKCNQQHIRKNTSSNTSSTGW